MARLNEWPARSEIWEAALNLWVGDQTQHVETVNRVLGEVQNIRAQEAK